MSALQDYISKTLTGFTRAEIVNLTKNKPASQSVIEQITARQLTRQRQDIDKWRKALEDAERDISPDRTELIRVYQDVVLDNHLHSLMETRKNKVLATKFKIEDANGKEDKDLTKKLNSKWFFDWLGHALDAIFYGYEVIEFGPIVDDEFQWVHKIREEFVVPEKEIIKKELGLNGQQESLADENVIRFREAPWVHWTTAVGDNFSLGLLNKLTPMALWKKNVIGAWSERAELFGMPIRIGKTLIRDQQRRLNMDNMMRNMGSAAWATLDKDDDIEFQETSRTDAHKVYNELIERANSEMSKAALGGTAILDEKSFVGSSEAHERNLLDFSTKDKRQLKFTIEMELFRLLRFHQLMTEEDRFFVWDFEEKQSKKDRLDVVTGLSKAGFKVVQKEVEDEFGFELEDAPEPVVPDPFEGNEPEEELDNDGNPITPVPALAAMYRDYFNLTMKDVADIK